MNESLSPDVINKNVDLEQFKQQLKSAGQTIQIKKLNKRSNYSDAYLYKQMPSFQQKKEQENSPFRQAGTSTARKRKKIVSYQNIEDTFTNLTTRNQTEESLIHKRDSSASIIITAHQRANSTLKPNTPELKIQKPRSIHSVRNNRPNVLEGNFVSRFNSTEGIKSSESLASLLPQQLNENTSKGRNVRTSLKNRVKTSSIESQQLIKDISPSSYPFRQQTLQKVEKKTPFAAVVKAIHENIIEVQKKVSSQRQFYHLFRRLLENKSLHLQGVYILSEIHEIRHDCPYVEKSLMGIINGAEFRYSIQAQRSILRSLLSELEELKNETFNLYLLQSKHEVNILGEKIRVEKNEVEQLAAKLSNRHKVGTSNNMMFEYFAHNSMPITYNKEKYEVMEKRMGKFSQISSENRFVCSEIEKVICKLKEVSYANNNPYKKEFF